MPRTRALTETIGRPDVTLLVEEFRCQTHSMSNAVGTNANHRFWTIRALGHGTEATESVSVAAAAAPKAAAASRIDIDSFEGDPTADRHRELLSGQPAKASESHGVLARQQTSNHIDRTLKAISLEVITDQGVGGLKAAVVGTQVQIKADEQQVFPPPMAPQAGGNNIKAKANSKAKLHDDWIKEWKFRSLYPAVGLVHPGEAWIPGTIPTDVPAEAGSAAHLVQTSVLGDGKLKTMHEVDVGSHRCPAVITKQHPSGDFQVMAWRPDQGGVLVPIELPNVQREHIFLTETGANLNLNEIVIKLEVPKSNPPNACVFIEGDVFHMHLGRVSPKSGDAKTNAVKRIVIDVPKPAVVDTAHRMQQQYAPALSTAEKLGNVQVSVGDHTLRHFLSGEVRKGDDVSKRMEKNWTLQFGPFATHEIKLTKKSHMVPVMTLTVDGDLLVEATSTDLGGSPDVWKCTFNFIGERNMDFKVFDQTKDGVPLDSQTIITKPHQYRHEIEITYVHKAIDNLGEASITIDAKKIEDLPWIAEVRDTDYKSMSLEPSVFCAQYRLTIPKKVAAMDSRSTGVQLGFAAAASMGAGLNRGSDAAGQLLEQAGGWGGIGSAAAKQMEEAGNNLSTFGWSAWEMVGSMGNASSSAEEEAAAADAPDRRTSVCGADAPLAPPLATMPTRGVNTRPEPGQAGYKLQSL